MFVFQQQPFSMYDPPLNAKTTGTKLRMKTRKTKYSCTKNLPSKANRQSHRRRHSALLLPTFFLVTWYQVVKIEQHEKKLSRNLSTRTTESKERFLYLRKEKKTLVKLTRDRTQI